MQSSRAADEHTALCAGPVNHARKIKGLCPGEKMPHITLDEAIAVFMMYNSLTYPTKAQQRALKAAEELIRERAEKIVERFKL
jgi:hypothetical protein